MARSLQPASGSRLNALAQHAVSSHGEVAVSADQVWSLVRDFCHPWHPAIDTMEKEYDAAGRQIRVFTVKEDNTVYKERLSWFSDSDRSMAYTHVQGIAAVEHYNARLSIHDNANGTATVSMEASLTADEPRATDIAAGTQVIFDHAIDAIQSLLQSPPSPPQVVQLDSEVASPDIIAIKGSPTLTVSASSGPDADNNTLCLFLHGIGGNRRNWNAQLTAVAPYCNVAALDLRGYGDSAAGEAQSTIDNYCDDIQRVATSFNATKLILCGLSYGAWIATSFATRYPDHLSALVLAGGCTGMSEAKEAEREAFRRSREVPLSKGRTPADFAPEIVSILAGPDSTQSVRNELLASMQAIPAETYADALRCFTSPTETFDFTKINMPVLLMTGEADKLAPPHEIKQVAERIHRAAPQSDVRYECIARAGHVCNLEAPSQYNTPLIELIQRVVR